MNRMSHLVTAPALLAPSKDAPYSMAELPQFTVRRGISGGKRKRLGLGRSSASHKRSRRRVKKQRTK